MMGGGWPKATPSITVMLGVGLCWPQVVLWVPLATNGVMLWVLVTKLVVMRFKTRSTPPSSVRIGVLVREHFRQSSVT